MTASLEEHTVKRYDQELTQLRDLVLEMGGLVEEQICKAVESLDEEDPDLARQVIERDRAVNDLELRADELATNLIALRQPLGRDLRNIMALARSVTDLERCGDEAERIARMAVRIYDSESPPPSSALFRDVARMKALASAMLGGSLDALARLDIYKAAKIARGDQELDMEFQSALRRLITYAMEDPRTIGHTIDVTFILRALERIGDHATNISESVIYFVKGKDIRHADPETVARNLL
jgi:phosphate transport system protein